MARSKTAPAPATTPPQAPAQGTLLPPVMAPVPVAPITPVVPAKVARTPAVPAVPPRKAFIPRGLEEIGREDIIIPRLTIVQPTSKVGKPGTFHDVVSGEGFPRLDGVVPIKWRKGRVFFSKPEDQEPTCASDDRVRPSARIDAPVKPECAGCPMSAWYTDEQGRRKHPKCQETYTLMLAFNAAPYFLTLKSSAMRNVKRILTQLKLQAQRQRRDIFGFAFDIALDDVAFTIGKAFVPRFEKLRPVPDAEYASYASIFDLYANVAPVYDPPAEGGSGAGDFDLAELERDGEAPAEPATGFQPKPAGFDFVG
ncbi:MAG: hypothetical protein ACRD3M_16095 [Thermoanaerobaculia bacterium]